MIYKFIDDNEAEITVNSLSSLQELVDSQTIKGNTKVKAGLRGKWIYNLMSVIAFGSILMTYFGVNFYLSGLHSYASGDQILSFQFIAIAIVIIAIVAFFAFRKYKRYY